MDKLKTSSEDLGIIKWHIGIQILWMITSSHDDDTTLNDESFNKQWKFSSYSIWDQLLVKFKLSAISAMTAILK